LNEVFVLLRQSLNGPWSFTGASARAKTAPRGPWAPASVPGNVHTDLQALGRLKDPLLADHECDSGWVEQSAWWYRRRFHLDAALQGAGRVRLCAEGLDTWCTLWLNGRRLGRTDNAFVEHSFEVAGLLKAGANELLLRFEPPMQALAALQARYGARPAIGEPLRVQGRKASYSFGWDWGPRLPTSGVFKDIYLEALPGLRVADFWVSTSLATAAKARGALWAEVEAAEPCRAELQASLGPWSWRGQRAFKKGLNRVKLSWDLKKPELWWPRGWGAPHLYQAEVSVGASKAAIQVGVRTVELERKKDRVGESFGFKVNGRSVYAKGANWIPVDSFPGRIQAARVERLLDEAVEANYSMLRVWGGGFYEGEAFYDACDRRGLLVWQDFLFACSEVPEHPEFMATVKAEAVKAVRRLRRHASLALLCGNNENHTARDAQWFRGRQSKAWGRRIYEQLLPAVCAEHAPGLPYWPGSPFGGKESNSQEQGDRHHWEAWAQFKDPDFYLQDQGRFISEFGFAAFPNRAVLRKAIPAAGRWLQSRLLQMHDKVENGGAVARLAYFITRHLPLAGGLDRFRYLSQVMQSLALRTGITHWRRLMPHNQGALIWQHNDCWPVISWALLDSDDAPKLGYYGVREAFDDVLLSSVESEPKRMGDKVGVLPMRAGQEDGLCEAWLSLDGPQGRRGILRVERWGLRGRQAVLARVKVAQPANSSRRLWQRRRSSLGITDPTTQYLAFHFEGEGGLRRRSLLFFERPMRLALPMAGLVVGAREKDGHVEVAVRSQALALACELHAPVPGRFSDNGFDLLPGETRILRFSPAKAGVIKGPWEALCLNQMAIEARRP
jgi:beta-mannosidase